MVMSCDVGSLPFFGNLDAFTRGAERFECDRRDDLAVSFEKAMVKVFGDKLAVGLDFPNFPQFRDMTGMFLGMLSGVERLKEGFVETGKLTLKSGRAILPEVSVLKENAHGLCERSGKPFALKVCVTGPYTLASFFPFRTSETFGKLGEVISGIVDANVFCGKDACVRFVSVDEPVFGLVDDPLIDHGSSGRENLLKAWTSICGAAKAKKAVACLHLHNTSDELFWSVASLDVVESHVDDPLYAMEETRKHLESADKVLKASVAVTDFDKLIRSHVEAVTPDLNRLALDEVVADTWLKLRRNAVAPEAFVEGLEVMRKRAEKIIARFGAERIPYVGPECGLRGFPSYESAFECLRRVAVVAKSLA